MSRAILAILLPILLTHLACAPRQPLSITFDDKDGTLTVTDRRNSPPGSATSPASG